ncbi:MAG: MoxR family ATPase [Bacteroidota bacterium]
MQNDPKFDLNEPVYLIDKGLKAAVEVALDLEMPLLVTGKPGTGKTKLASYVAKEEGCELLEFYTKTSSKARDLFYKYNALSHFRDSRDPKSQVNTMAYISYESLGRAILSSPEKRSVVLIDEIDKAPRDFPNDVLFEFEHLAFKIDEASAEESQAWAKEQKWQLRPDDQGYFRYDKKSGNRPILILTSNSEKNLPDAFMRRCVYYHIEFPDKNRLREIVTANLQLSDNFRENMLDHAIKHFIDVRNSGVKKAPATAELLSWIHLLNKKNIDLKAGLEEGDDGPIKEQIRNSYSLIAKNYEDRERLMDDLK